MQSSSDAELLAEYAARRSESAFTQLVERYVALVHSAALRQVGDAHLAQEVTQAVFILLARKAASLGGKNILAGWLCRTAHFAARDALKMERRRQRREHNAYMETISDVNASAHPGDEASAWLQLAPHLDVAVAQLADADRAALVLRFYEQRPLDEVGTALGVGADAAQKRVTRALEKLRALFAKHGVTLTAALIAGAVSANSVRAVPLDMAAKISSAALAGTAASTSALITATKIIAMTTVQKIAVAAAITAAVGVGLYEAAQARHARAEALSLQPLVQQIQQLQSERDDATNRLANLLAENLLLKSNADQRELLQLRGEVGVLRSQNQDLAQDNVRSKAASQTTLDKGFGSLGNYIAAQSAPNAGNSTPEALLQTFIYAMRNKDASLLDKVNMPMESEWSRMIENAFTNSVGFNLSSKSLNEGQTYRVRLDAVPSPDRNPDDDPKDFYLELVILHKENGWAFGTPGDPIPESN